jgi:hypothetical protein
VKELQDHEYEPVSQEDYAAIYNCVAFNLGILGDLEPDLGIQLGDPKYMRRFHAGAVQRDILACASKRPNLIVQKKDDYKWRIDKQVLSIYLNSSLAKAIKNNPDHLVRNAKFFTDLIQEDSKNVDEDTNKIINQHIDECIEKNLCLDDASINRLTQKLIQERMGVNKYFSLDYLSRSEDDILDSVCKSGVKAQIEAVKETVLDACVGPKKVLANGIINVLRSGQVKNVDLSQYRNLGEEEKKTYLDCYFNNLAQLKDKFFVLQSGEVAVKFGNIRGCCEGMIATSVYDYRDIPLLRSHEYGCQSSDYNEQLKCLSDKFTQAIKSVKVSVSYEKQMPKYDIETITKNEILINMVEDMCVVKK